MESVNILSNLKEVISIKRSRLNELIIDGIDEELIELSQELDILINDYLRTQI